MKGFTIFASADGIIAVKNKPHRECQEKAPLEKAVSPLKEQECSNRNHRGDLGSSFAGCAECKTCSICQKVVRRVYEDGTIESTEIRPEDPSERIEEPEYPEGKGKYTSEFLAECIDLIGNKINEIVKAVNNLIDNEK